MNAAVFIVSAAVGPWKGRKLETLSGDSLSSQQQKSGVQARGIRGANMAENGSEEAPCKGEEGEVGCVWEREGEEADLVSKPTHSECVDGANRRIYSRSEMEVFRFADVDGQQRRWKDVYAGMEAVIAREYDGLRVPNDPKKRKQGNFERRHKQAGKKDVLETAVEVFTLDQVKESDTLTSLDVAYEETFVGSASCTNKEVSYIEYDNMGEHEDVSDEDDDSDDEYNSIQRPAFFIEGEPDFDSGPPLDGLEYLRRVRWEAAQIPKVKVAQLNLSKLSGEQTPYMPSIPEIVECPPNLLPSKHWEDTFLADFSNLRQAFSVFENSSNQPSVLTMGKGSPKLSMCRQKPNGDPTMTAILGMDAASRASILRNSIISFEMASTLSRVDCLWLYALCATIDAPLDGNTCASVRCLLRKCSSILAAKTELDDEVAMLSILITITGRYFGQSENRR